MSIWHSVVDTFNKEKALVVAFSRHCKISRRPVDSFSEDIPACAHVDISIIPVWLRRSLRSSNTDIRHLFVSPSVAAFSDPFIVHGGLFLPVVIFRMYPQPVPVFWLHFCHYGSVSVLLDSLHASITTNTAQNSVCCGTHPAPIRDKSYFTPLVWTLCRKPTEARAKSQEPSRENWQKLCMMICMRRMKSESSKEPVLHWAELQ